MKLGTVYDFISAAEYAKRVGKSEEQVKVFLREGRIPDARKIGRDWVIHKDSVVQYPDDKRIKSGKYVGQHKKYYHRKSDGTNIPQ